ncbi:MAG: hypothetical protein BGO11_03040 [Solirubrobacterales bacterium 70-9]|nr:MAG: hypothetical protein BGO11_03040 [Solirubrobacterales bacterium 70-9]
MWVSGEGMKIRSAPVTPQHSAIPWFSRTRVACGWMTPFGSEVVPEVYIRTAGSVARRAIGGAAPDRSSSAKASPDPASPLTTTLSRSAGRSGRISSTIAR